MTTTRDESEREALADRIEATKRSWLPISGHVVNVTFGLAEADLIVTALRSTPVDGAREARTGAHLLQTAKSLGWPDEGEGALEFMLRRCREVAFEDCARSPAVDAMAPREAIARAIDLLAFDGWDELYTASLTDMDQETATRCADTFYKRQKDEAIAKADAILALSKAPAPQPHETDEQFLRRWNERDRAVPNEAIIPGSENMDARFAWLESKAADMGYVLVLVPEPEHPDSPHSEYGVLTVQALDWQETFCDRGDGSKDHAGWEADSGFGSYYSVDMYFGSDSYGWEVSFDCEIVGDFDDPDKGKAAAQADFEKRIRASLALPSAQRKTPYDAAFHENQIDQYEAAASVVTSTNRECK